MQLSTRSLFFLILISIAVLLQPRLYHTTTDAQVDEREVIATDTFDNTSQPWQLLAQGDSTATEEIDNGVWRVNFQPVVGGVTGFVRPLVDLTSRPEGVSFTIEATTNPFTGVINIIEADGSAYFTRFFVYPDRGLHTIDVPFSWLGLNVDSEDENGQLDIDQIQVLSLIDFSSVFGGDDSQLHIEQVEFWRGPAPDITLGCSIANPRTEPSNFLLGIQSSDIPLGESVSVTHRANGEPIDDILAFMASKGFTTLRLHVWGQVDGFYGLNDALGLARRAAELDMTVFPVLFFSETLSDIIAQPTLPEWENLSLDERAIAMRAFAAERMQLLLDTGVSIPFVEVGNEINWGFSGVQAGVDQRDLATLQTEIWPQMAILLRAAIAGVHDVAPEMPIMLHIASGYNYPAATAFFETMLTEGVDVSIAGLSFYPSENGALALDGLCTSIERLYNDLGLPVLLAEYHYPADPPSNGRFRNWQLAFPGYDFTPNGQADFLQDFVTNLQANPAVIGAIYTAPTAYWFNEGEWLPFTLFDVDGNARPAVEAFVND